MRLKVKANYSIREAELTKLGISREKEVIALNGDVTYHADGSLHTVTFDDELDERHSSFRNNTALQTDSGMARTLIDMSIERLTHLRQTSHPNAAHIIFAKNKVSAHEIADDILKRHNKIAVVLTEDTQDPIKVIRDFNQSSQEIIITIRMLGEGANIPRVRVVTQLTNYSTRMSVIQMWTRASRKEHLDQEGPSYIYCFKLQELLAIAESLDDVVVQTVNESDLNKQSESAEPGDSEQSRTSPFTPISAAAGNVIAIFRGSMTSSEQLRLAQTFRQQHPELAYGLSDTQIASIAATYGVKPSVTKPKIDQPETYDETNERLREASNTLANKLARHRNVNPREIHQEWINLGGPRNDDADNEQLQFKIDWLSECIANIEEPFFAV